MEPTNKTPILSPIDPEIFWQTIRQIIREELKSAEVIKRDARLKFQTPGLVYKPLYKANEICDLFQITRPTIYEWIKAGKLKPYKIQSRVYFLWNDIQHLLQNDNC